MTKLIYRDAILDDLPKIVDIYNSTIASRMVTADTEMVSIESKTAWFHQHNSEKRPLWVVENNHQEIVAWLSFQSFYGRPAYDITAEISIYIDELHRGNGYGKAILRYAIDQAPKLGIQNLLGFIFGHNIPSIKLFKKFGFEVWGNFPEVAILDGINRDLQILGLKI